MVVVTAKNGIDTAGFVVRPVFQLFARLLILRETEGQPPPTSKVDLQHFFTIPHQFMVKSTYPLHRRRKTLFNSNSKQRVSKSTSEVL